jgi:DNA ligase-1
MSKRYFAMLAHTYDGSSFGNWLWSAKIDGQRVLWDGGVSRGMLASEVPFANTEKDGRYITPPVATGLWSRYGKVIQAPDYFLDQLPGGIPLDGEMHMGPGSFQSTRAVISQLVPDGRWSNVKYSVVDIINYAQWLKDGLVAFNDKTTKYFSGILNWLPNWIKYDTRLFRNKVGTMGPFEWPQYPLPLFFTKNDVDNIMDDVLRDGWEGVVLKDGNSIWLPERSHYMLKYKPFLDAEGVIIGFTSGRETDKGSKLLGMIGAIIVSWNGKVFKVSGLRDDERQFETSKMQEFAVSCPGEDMPNEFNGSYFRLGEIVTFKYRELTDEGIPKEARYWRKQV